MKPLSTPTVPSSRLINAPLPALICLALLAFSEPLFSQQQPDEERTFRAGSSMVNITPSEDAAFPMAGYAARDEGHAGILDSLYFRTIVVDDGRTRAAIVVGDVIGIPDRMWEEMSERIRSRTGITPDHLILAGTHTHGGPSLFRNVEADERFESYTRDVAEKIVQSVLEAEQALQPARIGAARGYANVNVNRVARMHDGGYWLGQNPDGPSDKTVHVVRFESLDGEPIALLANYAVHAVVGGGGNMMITGDLAGATSRMVEEHYNGNVVVPWTSGAGGDQNPIYTGLDNLESSGRRQPLDIIGRILGEEVIRVSESMERTTGRVTIRGAQSTVTVPGKEPNSYRPDADYTFEDADPLEIRLSILRIGPVAIGAVSGEVLTGIGKRFKKESPLAETLMITHANGSSGYLPDDEAYERPGYEIMVTRAMEGTEDAVVNGLLDLLNDF